MKCPFCKNSETKVLDKRDFEDTTKRRRECLKCSNRFNTKEKVEKIELKVIKKDGRREEYDSEKLKRGINRALEKRPIESNTSEKIKERVEEQILKNGGEVSTQFIGNLISKELKKIDKIAYIRYASVYKDFKELDDFNEEIKELLKKKKE
jgi:transcriptional repressor NrdR